MSDAPLPPAPTPPAPEAPAPSESFGRYLQRERELRGVRLEQIAEQTRIGLMHLRALELDDLPRLPARVFLLGHIRAYARAIGLDPDEAALRFDEQWQKGLPPAPASVERNLRRWVLGGAAALLTLGGVATWLLTR